MQARRIALLIAALLTAVALPQHAPASPASTTSVDRAFDVPDEAALTARVRALQEAMIRKDFKAIYAMLAPGVRKKLSYRAWKADYGFDDASPAPADVLEDIAVNVVDCFDAHDQLVGGRVYRCSVAVKVRGRKANGASIVTEWGEIWQRVDGTWYFGIFVAY